MRQVFQRSLLEGLPLKEIRLQEFNQQSLLPNLSGIVELLERLLTRAGSVGHPFTCATACKYVKRKVGYGLFSVILGGTCVEI